MLDFDNYQKLNIQELNDLEYKKALLIDKRTFLQFYWDLIRKKHLIIFTFVPIDDYNLLSLKIASFLLQFSVSFTVDAFFFTDQTMHQIYKNKGDEPFTCHIPQIIYSSLISLIINLIFRQLSLSEKEVLSIKKEKINSSKKESQVRLCLRIKFITFFVLGFIWAAFCLYYISCFCAVYVNTQVALIKDSLYSFTLSMLFPFGTNLIPGFFRFPALRAKNQDRNFLYLIGQILALLI
jgi:hypothetical protein